MAKPASDQGAPEASGLMGLAGKEPPRKGLGGLEQERGPGAHERLGREHHPYPAHLRSPVGAEPGALR